MEIEIIANQDGYAKASSAKPVILVLFEWKNYVLEKQRFWYLYKIVFGLSQHVEYQKLILKVERWDLFTDYFGHPLRGSFLFAASSINKIFIVSIRIHFLLILVTSVGV